MKKNIFNFLLSLCLFTVSVFMFQQSAQAQMSSNPLPVAAFQVNGLGTFRGQYLTVYYSNSKASGISTDPEQIHMTRAYIVLKNIPIQQEVMLFKAQSVNWIENKIPNYLVFVIHQTPDFLWMNANTMLPDLPGGMRPVGHQNHSAISTLSMRDIEKLPRIQGSNTRFFEFGVASPFQIVR